MRFLQITALIMICFGVPVGLWEGMRLMKGAPTTAPNVTYVELITILLTGITVALAILAVLVGAAAIWGYANLKSESAQASRDASEAFMRKHIQSEAMRAMIKEAVDAREPSSADNVAAVYPSAFAPDESGAQGRIAEDYPGDQK